MLYGIEGILNGKLFGNGGSSGGSGGDSGGGGVGVAPMIDHSNGGRANGGMGYAEFVLSADQTVVAGGSIQVSGLDSLEIYLSDGTRSNPSGAGYGYLYGHPEITAKQTYSAKNGMYFDALWNSSATDFTFKAGETYTLVFLYHQ